jgi:hypothetical protein
LPGCGLLAGADFTFGRAVQDRNCQEPQKDSFAMRAWARIREKSFL